MKRLLLILPLFCLPACEAVKSVSWGVYWDAQDKTVNAKFSYPPRYVVPSK